MKELVKDAAIDLATLLTRFSFDLNGSTAQQLVSYWLSRYPAYWVQFALLEALYQGRYKARSIEQILMLWQRRGYPLYHFNHEFERIVRGRFSRHLPMQSLPRMKPSIAQSPTSHSAKSNSAVDLVDSVPAEPVPINQALNDQTLNSPVSNEVTSEVTNEVTNEVSFDSSPDPLPVEPLTSETPDLLPTSQLSEPDRTKLAETELTETKLAETELTEEPVQPVSSHADFLGENRLRLLSSAESIAFLKLRNVETVASSEDSSSDGMASDDIASDDIASDDMASDDIASAVARELPIQAFKPVAVLQSETITKMQELALAANRSPVEQIQQFVPTAESSDFYSKLKAVATERAKERTKIEQRAKVGSEQPSSDATSR